MKTTPIKSFSALIIFTFCAFQMHGQALLWEISGNGLTEKSYLYGTIHIKDKRVFKPLDTVVWNRFDNAKNFAMEFDIEKIDPTTFFQRIVMPVSYSALLPQEDRELLEEAMNRYIEIPREAAMEHTAYELMQQFKPFFVMSEITNSFFPNNESDAMDIHFAKRARKAKKPVLELESFTDQMDVIDEMTIDEQIQQLMEIVREPNLKKKMKKQVDQLMAVYLAQDDVKLYELSLEEEKNKAFMEKFLNKRNLNMIVKIKTFAADGSTFIAVGAAHLAGEEGLVNLLKKEGYTLTPVRFDGK